MNFMSPKTIESYIPEQQKCYFSRELLPEAIPGDYATRRSFDRFGLLSQSYGYKFHATVWRGHDLERKDSVIFSNALYKLMVLSALQEKYITVLDLPVLNEKTSWSKQWLIDETSRHANAKEIDWLKNKMVEQIGLKN